MNAHNKKPWCLAAALTLSISWLSGCQTYFPATGQTLPTGRYLEHPPQYIAPSPIYPLSKETYNLEQAANKAAAEQIR